MENLYCADCPVDKKDDEAVWLLGSSSFVLFPLSAFHFFSVKASVRRILLRHFYFLTEKSAGNIQAFNYNTAKTV